MAQLQWTDALALDFPVMDDTHREFVELLAVVDSAGDSMLLGGWRALVDHTDDHFSREDRWMQATGFSSANCHSVQHKVVLQAMREGLAGGEAGNLDVVRQMASELAVWFAQHAQSMDAALALHLRSAGFNPLTGTIATPEALPVRAIQGCGSAGCSGNDVHQPTADAA